MRSADGDAGSGGAMPPFPATALSVRRKASARRVHETARSFRRTGECILWRCLPKEPH
jgi:hypothetical protein